jgi:hypothetical protein
MLQIIIVCLATASILFGAWLINQSKTETTEKVEKEEELDLGYETTPPVVIPEVKKPAKKKPVAPSKNTAKPAALAKMEAKPKKK